MEKMEEMNAINFNCIPVYLRFAIESNHAEAKHWDASANCIAIPFLNKQSVFKVFSRNH